MNTQKIYGYTEMYIADCHDDNEFKMYIESELAQILGQIAKLWKIWLSMYNWIFGWISIEYLIYRGN